MTMDRTLKVHGGLVGRRSVLTRAERIARLVEEEKFNLEADSPLGLPKVRIRSSKAGTKTKKAEEPKPAEAAEGAEPVKAEGPKAPAERGAKAPAERGAKAPAEKAAKAPAEKRKAE